MAPLSTPLNLLFLLSFFFALASPIIANAPGTGTKTFDTVTLGSDVGGTAPSHRTSAGLLLWAVQSLLLGVFLLIGGKRGWRLSTGLGLALVLELVCWVIIVNALPAEGFSSASSSHTSIIIWAISTVAGLIGLGLGWWTWMVGMAALAACGGFALALSIVMMGDNDLPAAARWIIIGLLIPAGLVVGPIFQAHIGMALTSSLTGAFLLFLGIDCLVNDNRGMSLGLRYLVDHNSAHAADLTTYSPPVSTRVLLILIWIFAVMFTVIQTWVWRKAPFIRTFESLSEYTIRHTSDLRDPSLGAEMGGVPGGDYNSRFVVDSRERGSMVGGHFQDNSLDVDDSKSTLRSPSGEVMKRHVMEMSSPDDPPSRPNSIISTNLAQNLRSRPPTFFDMPVSTPKNETPPPPPVPTMARPPATSMATSGMSFDIPITQVPPAALISKIAPSDVTVSSDQGGEGAISRNSSSSKGSRRSWRKPVPALDISDDGTYTPVPHPPPAGGFEAARGGFDAGLLSGRELSLAPTVSTPSSGDISTILGAKFGATPRSDSPALPSAAARADSPAVDPRHSIATTNLRTGSELAHAQSPTVVSPVTGEPLASPSTTNTGRNSIDESFYTSSEVDHDDLRTPDLIRGATPSEDPSSVLSPADQHHFVLPGGKVVGVVDGQEEIRLVQ